MPTEAPIFYRIPRVVAGDEGYDAWSRYPHKWSIPFSGTTLCTACCGAGTNQRITGGSLNTTLIVERDPSTDACTWDYTESVPSTVTGASYSLAACGGVATAYTVFLVQFFYSSPTWFLRVFINGTNKLFEATAATPTATFTNTLLACNCPSVMGHGGSATPVPYI